MKRPRARRGSGRPPSVQAEAIRVYLVDLAAEIEGLQRMVGKMRTYAEQLQPRHPSGTPEGWREHARLLSKELDAFVARIDDLRHALPDITRAVDALTGSGDPAG